MTVLAFPVFLPFLPWHGHGEKVEADSITCWPWSGNEAQSQTHQMRIISSVCTIIHAKDNGSLIYLIEASLMYDSVSCFSWTDVLASISLRIAISRLYLDTFAAA